jgi:hypothetical protein
MSVSVYIKPEDFFTTLSKIELIDLDKIDVSYTEIKLYRNINTGKYYI